MPARRYLKTASSLCCLLYSATSVLAHMEMSWPYPLRSKFNPRNSYLDIDYSMTSPLNSDGSNFPCKGYQNDRPLQPTIDYTAGSSYNMTLSGSATHHGGSCQISLSYDNGATFRVIKSMIGGCPFISTYDFTIPSYAPSGSALLAWTWQNNEGNREYYMNCADVSIISGSYRRRRRQYGAAFESLPFIWKANLEGINECVTTEGEDPVYPNPGSDVAYGNRASNSSNHSAGSCDSLLPYGRTYNNGGDNALPAVSGSSNETTPQPYAVPRTKSFMSVTSGASDAGITSSVLQPTTPPNHRNNGDSPELIVPMRSSSTTTVTVECESTTIIALSPTTRSVGPTSVAQATPSSASGANSLPTNSHPPFATGDHTRYLPCVPGTFICTSSTTWEICDHNDGSGKSSEPWIYRYPRQVATGMECLPQLSLYSGGTEQYRQQANVRSGSYRDDQIVRARPDGDCSVNGSIQCTDGGQQFDICDQGGWVQMGRVAVGTMCRNGQIVTA